MYINFRTKISLILLFGVVLAMGQPNFSENRGIIKGSVTDKDMREALAGANIIIANTSIGGASDSNGKYFIDQVPVGFYTLEFSYIGYNTVLKADIIVQSNRVTIADAELTVSGLSSEVIAVTSGYFSATEKEQVSAINFSAEEIRRSPGTAGDVSRIVMSLPSIAKVNDQSNSLIVRGGSPLENGFYVDNIEIPNINHFPTQGSSGGPIGVLNVDYIKNVNFYSGGFSPGYGNRLSSVMDISFREGSRDNFEGQMNLNFAGFGGSFEGPLPAEKGSWMVSAKRSYLDLIIKSVDLGTSIAPVYGDIQGKVVYDIGTDNQLSWLTVVADDHSQATKKVAEENNMPAFGKQDYLEATTGLNWRKIWQKRGYSNTAISYSSQKYDNISYETGGGYLLRTNDSRQQTFRLRNSNHLKLNEATNLDFGFEGKWLKDNYTTYYSAYSDVLGNETDASEINKSFDTTVLAGFFSLQYRFWEDFTSTLGLRTTWFDYNERFLFAPRVSLSYKIDAATTVNASWGVFYQQLPSVLLTQLSSKDNSGIPLATHTIIGFEKRFFDDTRFLLEFYNKEYSHFPVNPTQPGLFLIDELYYNGFENFLAHSEMYFGGMAQSRGIEITLQKKMASDFYGLIAASYFKSRYKTTNDDIWQDRVYDNRFIFSIEGGYKPDKKWEFSLRWIFAGGAPYTPFDDLQSQKLNRAVLNANKINGKRYPDYHSLNIRFDRRFHFIKSNLVFYLSVWNAYDRKNIASYFWNQKENSKDVIYQWRMLPIFGFEYEF